VNAPSKGAGFEKLKPRAAAIESTTLRAVSRRYSAPMASETGPAQVERGSHAQVGGDDLLGDLYVLKLGAV
jgi:hypothetical protein